MVNIIHLNISFGVMIMMLLDHYIYFKFDKNKITMSLMIKDIQLLKNYNKIWKRNLKINENRL